MLASVLDNETSIPGRTLRSRASHDAAGVIRQSALDKLREYVR
jgi:hypothetical protein